MKLEILEKKQGSNNELIKLLEQEGKTTSVEYKDLLDDMLAIDEKITKLKSEVAKQERSEERFALFEKIHQEQNYHYIRDSNIWLDINGSKVHFLSKTSLMEYHCDAIQNISDYQDFRTELKSLGRFYHEVNYTFRETDDKTLNLLSREHWLKPSDKEVTEPHWLIDILVKSVGGWKKENWEHIEQVILAKYCNPANFMIPCMMIYGQSGGVGKNLIMNTLISTIFTEEQVNVIGLSKATGTFNASIAGKTVVLIDEATENKADAEKLKALIGNPKVSIEKKGIDAVSVDNTALYIMSGNDVMGSVRLEKQDTDRRYSIIHANTPIVPVIKEELDRRGIIENCTIKEAKAWIQLEADKILRDKENVADWLSYLVYKYGKLDTVSELHGEDYKKLTEQQKAPFEQLFEKVFLEDEYKHIKRSTLYKVYKENDPDSKMKTPTFNARAEAWLHKNLPDDHWETKLIRLKDGEGNESVQRCWVATAEIDDKTKCNDWAFVRPSVNNPERQNVIYTIE